MWVFWCIVPALKVSTENLHQWSPILYAIKNTVLLLLLCKSHLENFYLVSTVHLSNIWGNLFSHFYSSEIYPSAKENFWSFWDKKQKTSPQMLPFSLPSYSTLSLSSFWVCLLDPHHASIYKHTVQVTDIKFHCLLLVCHWRVVCVLYPRCSQLCYCTHEACVFCGVQGLLTACFPIKAMCSICIN